MFEKILVCLDGSELAEQILPYATEQAARLGSTVVLFEVVMEPVTFTPGFPGVATANLETGAMREHLVRHGEEAEAYLESVAAPIRKQNINVECVTLPGRAGEAIVDYAAQNDIGLITIATHGRSGIGRAIFGSVADYILRSTTLPVLLVKPR